MINAIIGVCLRRRTVVILAVIGVTVYGFRAYLGTPVESYPDVTNLQVTVIAQSPGLAPPDIERQVTVPLERALNGLPSVIRMRSESLFGLSLVYLTFEDDVDTFKARTLVGERLATAEMPPGVRPRLGPDTTALGQVLEYRLRSDRHTLEELRSEQEWTIGPTLRRVAGVGDVVSRGGFLKEVHVEIDLARLLGYGATLQDVTDAISRSNASVGGGIVRRGEQQMVVRGFGYFTRAAEIQAVVVKNDDGRPVTVGDVARVVVSHTPREGAYGYGHHAEAVQGVVFLRRGENPSAVLARLKDQIEAIRGDLLPEGMDLEIVYDRSRLVETTLDTVRVHLIEGALLVLCVVWLFVRSVKASLVIIAVVPLSLLVAFVALYHIGLPANLISLGTIDFGILVDGAVVLVEAVIHRARQTQATSVTDRMEIVSRAASEVARPILFAMAIIIASLIPVFMLERVEGRIFRPMAFTYTSALAGALVLSLTLVPVLSLILVRGRAASGRDPRWVLAMGDCYGRVLDWFLLRRWVVLMGAGAFLAGGAVAVSRLGTEFLPQIDEGDVLVFAEMPASISLWRGQETLAEVRQRLLSFPEVSAVTSQQGRPEDGTDNESVNMAMNFVRLKPPSEWRGGLKKADLETEMREALKAIPGVRFNFSQPIRDSVEEAMTGVRGQVVLKVYGEDLAAMRKTLQDAMAELHGVPGVVDLSLYRDREVPQLEIRTNRVAIGRAGLAVEDVQAVIETALAGRIVTDLWEGERVVPVRVRLAAGEREDDWRIGDIPVVGNRGATYPLRHLADIDTTSGRAAIGRESNSRVLALKFNVVGRDVGSAVEEAMRVVRANVRVPSRGHLEWGGEFENQRRAVKRLALVIPVALAVVLGLLYLGLGSGRAVASVLAAMPCALVGGAVALTIVRINLSVSAAIGFVTLLGQMSLASLLVLAAVEEQRSRGNRLSDAIRSGAKRRMRAVVMACLLAVSGLIPMAASSGMGSETQRPFAVVIVGGMVTVLVVSLVLLPVIYSLIARTRTTGSEGAP